MGVRLKDLNQLVKICEVSDNAEIFVCGKSCAFPVSEIMIQNNRESGCLDLHLQVEAEIVDWIDVELGIFPKNNSLVLVSFDNFDFPDRALYKEDADGGAFYTVGSEESFAKLGFFVNAWMPAPKSYEKF